jgi:hypothetical protein
MFFSPFLRNSLKQTRIIGAYEGECALKSHTQDDLRAPIGFSAQCKGIVIYLDHLMYC